MLAVCPVLARKRYRRRFGIWGGAPGISLRGRPVIVLVISRVGQTIYGPPSAKIIKAICGEPISRVVVGVSEGRPRYVTEGEAPVPANALSTPAEKVGQQSQVSAGREMVRCEVSRGGLTRCPVGGMPTALAVQVGKIRKIGRTTSISAVRKTVDSVTSRLAPTLAAT